MITENTKAGHWKENFSKKIFFSKKKKTVMSLDLLELVPNPWLRGKKDSRVQVWKFPDSLLH